MDEEAPWLKKSFFLNIIKFDINYDETSDDPLTIESCTSESGVENGCNFLSSIVRVTVGYHHHHKLFYRSYIIKAQLQNHIINESILFNNEILFYKEVIPEINKICQLEMVPKSFNSQLMECIVLEDLTSAGYVMCSSLKRLDFKHTKAVLVALAKFHAASVVLKRENPEIIKRNGNECVYTNDPVCGSRFKPRILMRLYGVAKVLQTMVEYKQFGNILLDAGEAFWELMVDLFKPNGKLNVLNHGDIWTNNIMFKYNNSGMISDVKFIDFQIRRYCSPAVDLLYLFWTSVDDFARGRMYELLELYRHTLNETLTQHRCSEHLARNQLKEEISKCSPIILLTCLYLPVIFPDPETPFDINQVDADEESMLNPDFNVNPILIPFKSNYYRSALQEMCRELDTMKIFQVLTKNMKQ